MSNLRKIISALDNDLIYNTPVDWAEKNRVLTPDITNWPGPMSYDRTPYLREIANSIMSDNGGEIFAIMKGSQIGFSIGGIFTQIGWIISESPSNTLFMVSDEEGVKRAMQGPIDQMINSSGISKLIRASNTRGGRNQKTGDTVKGKQFPNGNLYTWSGKAIGNLSQISCKYIFADEFERYPKGDKKAGSLVSLIEERAKSFADTRKIYFISTPEIKQTSNIEPIYLKGDQRKYHIPCKCCGEMIDLVWQKDIEHLDRKAGVTFDRDEVGKLIEDSVGYTCQKCGGFFKQIHVYECYENDLGEWIPTAIPINEKYVSYHISALYAPPGMYNWNYYAQKWCEIYPKNRPIKILELQTFWNQCLGLTWEQRGKEIKVNQLLKNTRNYDINTIPNKLSIEDGNGKIILITVAVDLNGLEDDARLDYEVLAWSHSGSSYSIDHGSIGTFQRSKAMRAGKAKEHEEYEANRIKWTYRINQKNNVWDEYKKMILSKIYLSEDGNKYRAPIHGIDTGHFTVHANAFVNSNQLCVALKGKSDNKYTKFDADKSYHKKSTTQDKLYLVEGDRIKDDLNENISLVWDENMLIDQPSGFMNYPKPTENKYTYKDYFHEYEGEKRELELNDNATAIGSRWVKIHSSSVNHFWDCRVYNIACRNIIVEKMCKAAKIPVSWTNFANIFK